MELLDTFSVPLPVDTVWTSLLDFERIAPCLPGASIDRVDGDDVHGSVRVKLGPISMRYQGVMTFTERDQAQHRVVMSARALEARGGGAVNATITASLVADRGSTDVTVVTDLDITGKPAQFGRGVIADVSKQLMGQFASNLSRTLQAGDRTAEPGSRNDPAAAPSAPRQAPAALHGPADADQALNAFALIQEPVKRLLPPLLGGVVLGLLLGRLGRRQSAAPAVTVVPLFAGQSWPAGGAAA